MIALVAGADGPTSLRLGASMVALQVSIGALNDVVDRSADAGRKPGKPIPAGQVTERVARAVVVTAALAGMVLAVPSGAALLVIGVAILSVGYGYDLRAKGTAWSWVPFAVGIPLLPVFAWIGATGGVPAAFVILLPTAMAAGAALAIGNARADLERDQAAGVRSVVTSLGSDVAWRVAAILLLAVLAVAIGSLSWWTAPPLSIGIVAVAGAVVLVGVGLGRGSTTSAARRERAWEIQAIGIALLAAAWLAGVVGLG